MRSPRQLFDKYSDKEAAIVVVADALAATVDEATVADAGVLATIKHARAAVVNAAVFDAAAGAGP